MAFKIDIEHRDRFLTFGPRFKGEVGKDIFAAKVALGILMPVPGSSDIDIDLQDSQVEFSYDPNIPFDDQDWFDCSTGLGVDLQKATKFDTTLENALLTFQIRNHFLIVSYYFEKFGYIKLLNSAISDETIFEAEVISQMRAAQGLFECQQLQTELARAKGSLKLERGRRPTSKVFAILNELDVVRLENQRLEGLLQDAQLKAHLV